MKFNIRKISAIGMSVLMAGLTLGTAMAANYPEPFVSGSTANAAIVWGTGSGVSTVDELAAIAIQADLGTDLPATGVVSFSGGETFDLIKSSDSFNFGDALNSVYTSLDDDEMEAFLQDGTYNDGSIDEEYDQKITLGDKVLTLFKDIEYNNKEPTLGFEYAGSNLILSYELEYDNAITMTDMNDTKMPLMGKEYYVLTAKPGEINLLDTADTYTLAQDESVTIGGKVITVTYISATATEGVKFDVDGEPTDKIPENEYEELADESYLVVTEVLYDAKESGISKVEFAVGAGKVDLVTGSEVEINDEDVDGLEVTLTEGTAGSLDKITLTWDAYDKEFLTEAVAFTMPGFETIKLAFGGLDFPSDPEVISIDGGATLTLSMGGDFDIDLMWRNETDYQTWGAENYELITATSTITNTTWTSPNLNTVNSSDYGTGEVSRTDGLDLGLRDRIIVTRIDDDLGETEQFYWEVDKIENKSGVYDVRLDDVVVGGTSDVQFTDLEEETKGDIILNLVATNSTGTSARIYLNFTAASGTVTYNKVVSDTGLVLGIPATAEEDAVFTLTEADKDGDLFKGAKFTLTVGNNSDDDLYIKSHNLTYNVETLNDDEYLGYVVSNLATKIEHDKGPDAHDIVITYWGEEVTAQVTVASSDAEVVSEGVAAIMVVLDTEVASVASKNLIVVGGSCINSAAASLVGGSYCGDSWTTATGVGSGQFMIKSYTSGIAGNSFALLVAGYEKDDTTNAATYLRTKLVDTSKSYISTSSTTVTEV